MSTLKPDQSVYKLTSLTDTVEGVSPEADLWLTSTFSKIIYTV